MTLLEWGEEVGKTLPPEWRLVQVQIVASDTGMSWVQWYVVPVSSISDEPIVLEDDDD